MIYDFIFMISIVFLICLTGFLMLALFKNLLEKLEMPVIIASSWLTGCLIISFISLIFLLISFAGIQINVLFVLLIPLLVFLGLSGKIATRLESLRHSISERTSEKTKHRFITDILFIVVVVFFAEIVFFNYVKPVWAWDAWMIWSIKAKLISLNAFDYDLLRHSGYIHMDYPLLVPLVQAVIAGFKGVFSPQTTQVFFSMTFISYAILIYSFTKKHINNLLSWLLLISFIAMPVIALNFMGAYADGVLSTYHMLALYFLYQYLFSEKVQVEYLIPAGAGFAAMIMTKNEGMLFSLTLFIISTVFCLKYCDQFKTRAKSLLVAFLVAILLNLPWLLSVKLAGITNDIVSLSGLVAFEPAQNLNRLPDIVDFLFMKNMFNLNNWGLLYYVFTIFLIAGITGRCYRELTFFGGLFLLNFSAIIAVYLISPHEVLLHLYSSADRVFLGILPVILAYIVTIAAKKPSISSEHKLISDNNK